MKKTALVLLPLFWPKMPPLGIASLQAYASFRGFPVDIIDYNCMFYNLVEEPLKKDWLLSCYTDFEDRIFEILRRDYPDEFEGIFEKLSAYDTVGFSCFKSNLKTTRQVMEILKTRKPDLRIILGGPEMTRQFVRASGCVDNALLSLADAVVAGEGEKPFVDFLEGRKHKITQFDELENNGSGFFPRYEGMDLNLYPRKKALSIAWSRGCVRRCAFCSEKLLWKRFKTRPARDVIEEMRFHRDKNAVETFVFHDSMINADPDGLEDLCGHMIEAFGSVPWEAQAGVRPEMEERLLKKMKESGCYHLFIGLESGSDRTLGRMKKGYTAPEARQFFQKLKSAGLSFGVSMIVGFPGETEEDFQESLNFIIQNKGFIPKVEQVNPFVYYDGTGVSCSERISESESSRRMEVFVSTLRANNIKYTKAFVGNLIGK